MQRDENRGDRVQESYVGAVAMPCEAEKTRPETGSVQFSYFVARRRVPSRLVQGGLFPRQLVGGAAKHDQQHMALLDELAHRAAIWPMAPKKKLGKRARAFKDQLGIFIRQPCGAIRRIHP